MHGRLLKTGAGSVRQGLQKDRLRGLQARGVVWRDAQGSQLDRNGMEADDGSACVFADKHMKGQIQRSVGMASMIGVPPSALP
jgi:hypothetical protein